MVQSNSATITESLKINSNNLLGFYDAKSLGRVFTIIFLSKYSNYIITRILGIQVENINNTAHNFRCCTQNFAQNSKRPSGLY